MNVNNDNVTVSKKSQVRAKKVDVNKKDLGKAALIGQKEKVKVKWKAEGSSLIVKKKKKKRAVVEESSSSSSSDSSSDSSSSDCD